MSLILAAIAYIVYFTFCLRLLWHLLLWLRAPGPPGRYTQKRRTSPGTWVLMIIDLLTFRRVFVSSGPLWFGSMLFHVSFFLVCIRHLRYFTDPVPFWVQDMQVCGIVAGYVLPASILYLLSIRTISIKHRYLTYDNYLVLGLTLLISLTGLFMLNFFKPDLLLIKEFSLGLLAFHPTHVGGSYLFLIHTAVFFLLALLLPSHVFSAPVITMEARRREESLPLVMHEK
ncbi:MAG: hypothetical protein HZB33_14780 [Nitrospirae bacterium]|nr:hypothetical protein [Nitrospirota bacterium]